MIVEIRILNISPYLCFIIKKPKWLATERVTLHGAGIR
jgi:hypothetical protein